LRNVACEKKSEEHGRELSVKAKWATFFYKVSFSTKSGWDIFISSLLFPYHSHISISPNPLQHLVLFLNLSFPMELPLILMDGYHFLFFRISKILLFNLRG
jgi:hypothetical protein